MAQIGIIGAGSWGTALAVLLAGNGHAVRLWSAIESEIMLLKEKREHSSKLPGVKLPESIQATTDLQLAMADAELLVLAVPSVFVRETARSMKAYYQPRQIVVNVAKGIEEDSLMTMVDIIEEELGGGTVCVLSGPSHAEEVGKKLPTTIVVGAKTRQIAEHVQSLFMNGVFRVYTSPDILGIELGGSLKNVIALAAGMADGLGFGDNTKAALITRGIHEIGRLALAMGAKAETLNGLTGIGDLIVTCASVHSRNRKAGMLIGQGKTPDQAMDEVQMVVEGVYSAKAAVKLGEKYQVSLPIIERVNKILFEELPVKEAIFELMQREKKTEYENLEWET
ncbi:glycerol-3-phosphate dehydrogenase [NAD(P)+] [Clostridia bacterium]|nr:glycerol-3-phosphate dehydrogenase [NAD(P)+] [Clostridia bacterium]